MLSDFSKVGLHNRRLRAAHSHRERHLQTPSCDQLWHAHCPYQTWSGFRKDGLVQIMITPRMWR